jgi:acetyltransferase
LQPNRWEGIFVADAGIWRALSLTEKIHAGKEAYIGYTVRTSGRLDTDALVTAYEAVCRAYPQFAAAVKVGEDGPVFVESDALPEVRISDGDLDRPLAGVELDQRRATSTLNVVRDGDDASVCLVTHHSIADAHHATEVLAALWSCYTDVVHGVPVDLPRYPFPRSLEDLLAERGIHSNAPAGAPKPPATQPLPERAAVVRHVVQHRLTTAQTTALTELGHREHVTINSLLSGALLLAEAEIRGLPLTELMFRFTVNLRSRLTPKVGATEGTNVLGGAGFTATKDIAPDAVAIGRVIGEQLRAGLADGSIQRSILDMVTRQPAPDAKPWDPSSAPAVVSMMNWGQAPPMRTPEDLRLTNLHSASSIREFTALGGYVVSSFDGRIGIDLAWPEQDAELPKRLACVREQLDRLTLQP